MTRFTPGVEGEASRVGLETEFYGHVNHQPPNLSHQLLHVVDQMVWVACASLKNSVGQPTPKFD